MTLNFNQWMEETARQLKPYCPDLSETELSGLVAACVPVSVVEAQARIERLEAALRHIAERGGQEIDLELHDGTWAAQYAREVLREGQGE